MKLRIASTTDGKFVGDVMELPGVPNFGTLSKRQIQAFAATIYDARFVPDSVFYFPSGDRVRLVNSNYSVVFEDVTDG